MSKKYLSLILNAIAVAVLLVGTVGVARQSALANKKINPSNVQALAVVDPAMLEGYKMLGTGLAVFDQITKAQSAAVADSPAVATSRNAPMAFGPSGKTLFAGSYGEKLEKTSNQLAVPRSGLPHTISAKNMPVNFKTIAVAQSAEKAIALPVVNAVVQTGKAIALPVVNVVIQTGKSGKAMIDGSIVGVSDKLASGYVVKSIAMDLITLSKENEEVELRVPLDRLRVLGVHPPSREKRSD